MIQETRDYSLFKLLGTNRDIVPGHVERLKKAFETFGNITETQPILVNSDYEVIDGQHRLQAAKELHLPVHYIVAQGLNIEDARAVNILHNGWKAGDYAKSYAAQGMTDYILYNQFKDDYNLSHKKALILITGRAGAEGGGMHAAFRQGEFSIVNPAEARKRLEAYQELRPFLPFENGGLVAAFVKCWQSPSYDQRRMVHKLRLYANNMLKPFTHIEDNLRQLEELYNFGQREDNRVRLY